MKNQTLTGFMASSKSSTRWRLLKKNIKRDKYLLLLITPVLIYFMIVPQKARKYKQI